MNKEQCFILAAFLLLCCASVCDIRKREIAVWTMGAAACVSFLNFMTQTSAETLLKTGLSMLPGLFLIGIATLAQGSMGYGDGLMALLIGPCFGLQRMVTGLFLAFFFSALASIALISMRKVGRKTTLPFIPFRTAGMGVMQLVL